MKKYFILLSALVLLSCGKSLPVLENFDENKWKNDRNACANQRVEMQSALEAQQEKLLALKEMQIVQLLGRPDGNELFERNKKFYTYYITPSAQCSNASVAPKRLEIRFNAIGVSKEVYIK